MEIDNRPIDNPHIIHVLKNMCKIVKATYEDIDFKKEKWFMEYEWTKEQEQDFIKWLTDYLYTDKEARISIARSSFMKTIKYLRKVAKEFTFMYGWKTKL